MIIKKVFSHGFILLFLIFCPQTILHAQQAPLYKNLEKILTTAHQIIEQRMDRAYIIMFSQEVNYACSDLKRVEQSIPQLPGKGYNEVRARFQNVTTTINTIANTVEQPEDLCLKHVYWLERCITKLEKIVVKRLKKPIGFEEQSHKTRIILTTIESFTKHMKIGVMPLLTKHTGTTLGRTRDFLIHNLLRSYWWTIPLIAVGTKFCYDAIQKYRNKTPEENESRFLKLAKKTSKFLLLSPLIGGFMLRGNTDGMLKDVRTGSLTNQPIERVFVKEHVDGGDRIRQVEALDEQANNQYKIETYPGLQQNDAVSCSLYAVYHTLILYKNYHEGTPLRELTNRAAFEPLRRFWQIKIKRVQLKKLYKRMKASLQNQDNYVAMDRTHNAWIAENEGLFDTLEIEDAITAWCNHMKESAPGFTQLLNYWTNKERLDWYRNYIHDYLRDKLDFTNDLHHPWFAQNKELLKNAATFDQVFNRWKTVGDNTGGNALQEIKLDNPRCGGLTRDLQKARNPKTQPLPLDNETYFKAVAALSLNMPDTDEVAWLIQKHIPELTTQTNFGKKIKENILVISCMPGYNIFELQNISQDFSRNDPPIDPPNRYIDFTRFAEPLSPVTGAILRYRRQQKPIFFIVVTPFHTDRIQLPNTQLAWQEQFNQENKHWYSLRKHYFAGMVGHTQEGKPKTITIDSIVMHDNGYSQITHGMTETCAYKTIENEDDFAGMVEGAA